MPTLPARSRLYRLEPYGIGTPWVESLTGYITRLAEAHCVSTGILYAKEIAPVVGKGNIFTFRLTGTAGYPTHAINGLGVTAADFDGSGQQALVTGAFFFTPPFNRMSRITLWRRTNKP